MSTSQENSAAKVLLIPLITLLIACLAGCGASSGDSLNISSPLWNGGSGGPGFGGVTPVYGFRVINTYPHQTDAFTEGLVYDRGRLYESCGLVGESKLREVDLTSGQVLREVANPAQQFAEGLALRAGRLYQLTLHSGVVNVWDQTSFTALPALTGPIPAWGLTYSSTFDELVLSDGSSTLTSISPTTFQVVSSVNVTDNGNPVNYLNELETVGDVILANRFTTDEIVAINPENGVVLYRVNLAGLIDKQAYGLDNNDVLNGIAYDAQQGRLFVTGKHWPFLYEIEFVH